MAAHHAAAAGAPAAAQRRLLLLRHLLGLSESGKMGSPFSGILAEELHRHAVSRHKEDDKKQRGLLQLDQV